MMIPTLFSVSYAGLWGQHRLSLSEFLRKAAALGYAAVELMGKRPHLSVLDVDLAAADRLRQEAQSLGVEIATVAGYTDFTLGRHMPMVPAVEIQVIYVRELARLAQRLGAKIVRVFTGLGGEAAAACRDWDQCVQAVRQCAAVAAEFGVILGVQNHHDVGASVAAYVEFLDEVNHPNCRAMFDPWVPALLGEDLRTAARRLAPRMVQTTLADYVRLPRYAYVPGLENYRRLEDMLRAVPLGEGFVDLEGFMAGLREGGFQGYVAYEMCAPLRGGGSEENLDRAAALSLARIKQWMGQPGA